MEIYFSLMTPRGPGTPKKGPKISPKRGPPPPKLVWAGSAVLVSVKSRKIPYKPVHCPINGFAFSFVKMLFPSQVFDSSCLLFPLEVLNSSCFQGNVQYITLYYSRIIDLSGNPWVLDSSCLLFPSQCINSSCSCSFLFI